MSFLRRVVVLLKLRVLWGVYKGSWKVCKEGFF